MAKEMKAANFSEFGGPEKVKISVMEVPELKEGEVLIRVKAAGVNPVDAVISNGYYKDMMPHSLPVIPGWDICGVVEDRGMLPEDLR
jgi:NADPH:quinone reductase-like Zn-dependent oxidoreductase